VLEAAETGSAITKEEFDAAVPPMRVDLLNAQYDLRETDFSVALVIAGNDRMGCESLLNRLHEWMDARFLETNVRDETSEDERERPRFWRHWRVLPPHGRIGIYFGAWPLNAVADRLRDDIDDEEFERRLSHCARFEEDLVLDGTLLLKVWLHLPRKELKKRLKKWEKDPDQAWRVAAIDWDVHEHFEAVTPVVEQMLRRTGTGLAPWQIVESTDARYRDLTVARTIRDALTRRLAAAPGAAPVPAVPATGANALDRVDLGATMTKDDYDKRLEKLQAKLARRQRDAMEAGVSSVLVFEGWDAAGKGGVIRRLTGPLPARAYTLVPIAAPTEEERVRHYLWRFWRHLPRAGRMVIFDRSWYGRVLVERVEGFAREDEWRRAYEEINDFEAQLADHGMLVRKFWLHVDPDEQLARFKAREKTPYKQHKITDEDYRNREQWEAYVEAINEMVARTSNQRAPWSLVSANDKRNARLEVLETVCDGLGEILKSR
jgi:polyphosphate:AMP phosphotransferase